MKKYLFYVARDGGIQCLYAETSVSMIETDAENIMVIEAENYEEAHEKYITNKIVAETLRHKEFIIPDDSSGDLLHRIYFGY